MQDKQEDENFSRLRVVPAAELNADALADTTNNKEDAEDESEQADEVIEAADGEELTLVDESGQVVARSKREVLDASARQKLTIEEIEELKKKGASAGKDLIAKLLLSHTALDQKTEYSLAKYKLLKTKKYIRRFTVLPLDVPLLAHWMLEDRDAAKILEMRQEFLGLIGCWADVHFAAPPVEGAEGPHGGRWLVVDDASGMLVAAMAERMGFLYPEEEEEEEIMAPDEEVNDTEMTNTNGGREEGSETNREQPLAQPKNAKKRARGDDLDLPYAPNNTITVIHHNTQANLSLLRYFDFDNTDPNPYPPYHPLFTNILPISWLQLVSPETDPTYTDKPVEVSPEELASWKTNRRGNYHRKRRRWARTKHIVESTMAGGFSGLATASTLDPISLLRHTLPLLAGGAPIAVYSQSIEPLTQLAECFSVSRRGAWVSDPPAETDGRTREELERWEGSAEFPVNPTLVLGASIQSSRARRWQVLPGRTHPLMTERGGAEGYLFTGWKALPVEGRIEARGKYKRRKGETV